MKQKTYNGVLTRKLLHLRQTVTELRSWPLGSLTAFAKNRLHQYAVERALQVCAEIVIDVCARILALEKVAPGETALENVQRAATLGVLSAVEDYADLIRFRNFVVHRYEQVDPEILFTIVKRHLGTFDQFEKEVGRFVEQRRES